jgi:hypothetical protein
VRVRDLPPGTRTSTLRALVARGYVAEGEDPDDSLTATYALTPRGAALAAAARKAEDKPNRDEARRLADELLRANNLDGRADLAGVYPVAGQPGLYEVEYDERGTNGRFVVTVNRETGAADLQRQ